MSRDVRRYWKEVRALEASLPEFMWLVAAEGGDPVQVPAAVAAKLLHAQSHRAATEEELGAKRAKEKAGEREVQRDGLRRRGVAVVDVQISRGRLQTGPQDEILP